MRPDADARFQVDGVPTHVPNYIHIIGVGVDCGAPCNNGEASMVGSGPPASRDPTAGENGDASIPNIPGREITATYMIHPRNV